MNRIWTRRSGLAVLLVAALLAAGGAAYAEVGAGSSADVISVCTPGKVLQLNDQRAGAASCPGGGTALSWYSAAGADNAFVNVGEPAQDTEKFGGLTVGEVAQNNSFFATPGSHSVVVPPLVRAVVAEVRGAGGGGEFFSQCSGGGQGGLVRAWVPALEGDTLTVTVGEGGQHGIETVSGLPGHASLLAVNGAVVATATGGKEGRCSNAGDGGTWSVNAPAVGIEAADGADGRLFSFAGGIPGFFGSGSKAGENITAPGANGYVLLHLMR